MGCWLLGVDGDPITSCVIKPAAPGKKAQRRPSPSSAPGKALTELQHLIIAGKYKPSHGHDRAPIDAKIVEIDD
jgi:hypothetical protein